MVWHEDTNAGWREHVTPYLYRHPERFRLVGLSTDPSYADQRWSVDTAEDLDLVSRLWAALMTSVPAGKRSCPPPRRTLSGRH